MKISGLPLLTAMLMAISACSMTKLEKESSITTFVIVRHAEKSTDDVRDPSLSEAGHARAQALARLLAGSPISAAYATQYRRTQQTAAPTTDANGISLSTYDAALPVEQLAAQLRATHANGGTVLVVGHSNTVPALVAALCGCATAPMDDSEYDRLSIVRIGSDGRATLEVGRYGAPSSP